MLTNLFRCIFERKHYKMSKAATKLYGYKFPAIRTKQVRPPFPGGTFVYPDHWYDSWNKETDKRLKKVGWTKKEIKQGWRWVNFEDIH